MHAGGAAALSAKGLKPAGKARIKRELLQEDAIAFQVRITGEVMREALQQRLARHGIRLAHWSYLRVLWREDGISQIELSARVRRVGANTVSALNNLERMGLVRRARNKTDRRAVKVFLTAAGRALEAPLVGYALEVQELARTGIPEQHVDIMRDVLKAIRANLGAG